MRALWTSALAVLLAAGVAQASSIGIYFAADGSDCDDAIQPFMPFTFSILVHTYGDLAVGGITGAEFRMSGFPAGWFATPTAAPAFNTVIGNPLTGGVNIAAGSCVIPAGGWIPLFSVSGLSTSPLPFDSVWAIEQHSTPTNPSFPCPVLVVCDAPVFTKFCVAGGVAFPGGRPCPVSALPATWSSVKGLYAR